MGWRCTPQAKNKSIYFSSDQLNRSRWFSAHIRCHYTTYTGGDDGDSRDQNAFTQSLTRSLARTSGDIFMRHRTWRKAVPLNVCSVFEHDESVFEVKLSTTVEWRGAVTVNPAHVWQDTKTARRILHRPLTVIIDIYYSFQSKCAFVRVRSASARARVARTARNLTYLLTHLGLCPGIRRLHYAIFTSACTK